MWVDLCGQFGYQIWRIDDNIYVINTIQVYHILRNFLDGGDQLNLKSFIFVILFVMLNGFDFANNFWLTAEVADIILHVSKFLRLV